VDRWDSRRLTFVFTYVQNLMRDCSGKSRVYHLGSKNAMPPEMLQFKFHPNQLPANIHRLSELILRPQKL